jgi:hypothetical protein
MLCNDGDVDSLHPAGARPLAGGGNSIWSLRRQWLAALLGMSVLAAGAVATFMSANGAGSAALVVGGVALLLSVMLGDRLESLKVGNVEFRLREAALQLTQQAVVLEAHGDLDAAERLRQEAGQLLLQASPAVRAYEELRRVRPHGAERLADLNRLIDGAKEYSRRNRPSAEAVSEMFSSGGDGERVYALALMEADPETSDVDCILDSISHSRSAFEQGQALRVALRILARLDSSDRGRLSDAIQQQLRSDGHIEHSTERRRLAEQILAALDN